VTHEFASIYASDEAYLDDLFGMQQIIYNYTGVTTTLMRFPGGSSNTVSSFNPGIMTRMSQQVQAMGFKYFDWDVDSQDAGGANTAQQVKENVIAGIRQQRRYAIVLQHDIKSYSVEAVEAIIQWGLENGYVFLPLDPTSPTMHHGINN
jgi:peptidoglycan/xylan/chitin deacetylase (PgdA/CDA1 family)